MGGEPRFCLVSLAAPKRSGEKWIADFYRGLLRLARRTGTALAGGDLAHAEKVYCDVMVCGSVRGARLCGATARGPAICCTSPDGSENRGTGVFVPQARSRPGSCAGIATSCIDLSDGLSLDLHRLCVASGVAAEIDRVPVVRGATLERALAWRRRLRAVVYSARRHEAATRNVANRHDPAGQGRRSAI